MNPDDPIVTRIVIRRNQSLDRGGFARVVALVAGPSGAFMVLAAEFGWWPILTFCAGVLLLFVAVLYAVMAAGREREVITVLARRMVVESGRYRPRMRVELDRYWTRVEQRGGTRPCLALVSRGTVVEIAAMLAGPERDALAHRLRALVGPHADYRESAAHCASDPAHPARSR